MHRIVVGIYADEYECDERQRRNTTIYSVRVNKYEVLLVNRLTTMMTCPMCVAKLRLPDDKIHTYTYKIQT